MKEPVERKNESLPDMATVPSDLLEQPRRLVLGERLRRTTFAAFRHRNYRLFFSGQMVSLIGTWMQTVAEGWLVYQLTNSPLALGVIRFLHTIPITLFSLPAGAIADRHNKRNLLIVTQSASMIFAFVLAVLVFFGVVRIWQVGLLGVCLGMAYAFDIPTRQSFVVEMVGKEDLMNAIALNSSMFNAARILGPALAGILIAWIGLSGCFFLNGFSFLAVITSYFAMRLRPAEAKPPPASFTQATLEALRYVAGQRVIRAVLALVGISSLFAWPYSVLMPAFARDVLHVGAKGYGYLMAANGVGAFLGAITLASLGNRFRRRHLFFLGVFGFSGMLVIFAFSSHFWLSAAALAGIGWFMIIFFATANTVVQTRVPDELRGRVMGVYSLCFLGVSPIGSLLAGTIAKWTSVQWTIGLGAGVCMVAATVTLWMVPAQPASAADPPPQIPPEE